MAFGVVTGQNDGRFPQAQVKLVFECKARESQHHEAAV